MDLSPQAVRTAEFASAKRGVDPAEVRSFLEQVADALETAQNQSTAMEARARAAVARLQELSDDANSQAATARSDEAALTSSEQAETISRTLLLAQRTADTAIAQAEAEAQRLVTAATEEAAATLDSTREMAARLMEEAREEARKAGEAERLALASEVDSLKARRDFLESDVEHLEHFLAGQRSRLRDAAAAMIELTERVDAGLAEVRRPLLSAADDEAPEERPDVRVDAHVEAASGEVSIPADDEYAGAAELAELVGDGELFQPGDTRPASADEEIGEFPPAEVEVPFASGELETGFDDEDVTGDHEQPDDNGGVQFSFDDRR